MAKDLDLKKSSDIAVFEPTALMEKFVDVSIDNLGESKKRIAELTGMDESTFYKWRKQDGFEAWYTQAYEARLHRIRPHLDAIGLKFARRGEYNFWKDMQKVAGRNLDTQQTNIQVNITPILEDEPIVLPEEDV